MFSTQESLRCSIYSSVLPGSPHLPLFWYSSLVFKGSMQQPLYAFVTTKRALPGSSVLRPAETLWIGALKWTSCIEMLPRNFHSLHSNAAGIEDVINNFG